jgi:hypothetical protein
MDEKKKPGSTELSDAELKDVSGGRVAHGDIQITKYMDKVSPQAFLTVANASLDANREHVGALRQDACQLGPQEAEALAHRNPVLQQERAHGSTSDDENS